MVKRFTDAVGLRLRDTLAQKLIPIADSLRDILTKFGMRPYKVKIVRVRWTGERRGIGSPVVVNTLDILPTPLVQDLTTLTEIVHPIGLDEIGSIIVSEISGRFTDDELRFLDKKDGEPPAPNEEVFYEIEFPKPDGSESVLRRFFLRSAPHYFAGKFQWQVRLEKSHDDRTRDGDPR